MDSDIETLDKQYSNRLLLRHASQNSLDESSQKHLPRSETKHKLPYRNPQHFPRAFDNLNLMRRQTQLCDVVLVADDIEVPSHKMVLASCSPYFHAMFTTTQREIVGSKMDIFILKLMIFFIFGAKIRGKVTDIDILVYLRELNSFLDGKCRFMPLNMLITTLSIKKYKNVHSLATILHMTEPDIEQHYVQTGNCTEKRIYLTIGSQGILKSIRFTGTAVAEENGISFGMCIVSLYKGDIRYREPFGGDMIRYDEWQVNTNSLLRGIVDETALPDTLRSDIIKATMVDHPAKKDENSLYKNSQM
ncbi:unnamed protein product, partial [Meganyctiphanes norvegica]